MPFDSIDDAIKLAGGSEHGLSLGVLTHDVMSGLEIADRIPTGIVHINDQTIGDEVVNPFGGVKAPGAWLGGAEANIESFTHVQWVTMRGELPDYPFCRPRRSRADAGRDRRGGSGRPDAVAPAAPGGIDSVVLEARSREYVEQRVRAGVLEDATVELFRETGLAERLDREAWCTRASSSGSTARATGSRSPTSPAARSGSTGSRRS